MTFGQYFRHLRMEQRVTLRKFCQEHGYDPGNISKIERDVFAAPQDQEKLRGYAFALGLKEGSAEWIQFFDLATVSNRVMDLGQISNEALLRKVPVLFRTLENKELTEEELEQLIEKISELDGTLSHA
jgi:transcriptional regulator with XRE-family HTH domain